MKKFSPSFFKIKANPFLLCNSFKLKPSHHLNVNHNIERTFCTIDPKKVEKEEDGEEEQLYEEVSDIKDLFGVIEVEDEADYQLLQKAINAQKKEDELFKSKKYLEDQQIDEEEKKRIIEEKFPSLIIKNDQGKIIGYPIENSPNTRAAFEDDMLGIQNLMELSGSNWNDLLNQGFLYIFFFFA